MCAMIETVQYASSKRGLEGLRQAAGVYKT